MFLEPKSNDFAVVGLDGVFVDAEEDVAVNLRLPGQIEHKAGTMKRERELVAGAGHFSLRAWLAKPVARRVFSPASRRAVGRCMKTLVVRKKKY